MGPLVLIGLGLLAYNYQRFGQLGEFGQRYQLAGSRQEAAQLFRPRYLWFNLRVYFFEPIRWTGIFPFVGRGAAPPLPVGPRLPEDPFGVLAGVPLVWLALAAPLAWRERAPNERAVLRSFVLALAWLAGTAVLVLGLLDGSCSRYEVDFLPELVFLAVLGLLGLERFLAGFAGLRLGLRAVWMLLLGGSVAFNLLVAVAHHLTAQADLGDLLLDAGRPAEAIRVLEQTLRWQPGLAPARVELGDAYVRLGRMTDALGEFAEVLRRDPENFEAHANLANGLVQTGRYEEGAAEYRLLLRRRPDFAVGNRGLGFALARLGRREEALAAYAAALALDPNDAVTRDDLGSALGEVGRVTEAADQFRAALRLNPGDATAHGNLGLALAQEGQMAAAAAEFRAALQLSPDSGRLHGYLGTALGNLGRLDEAIAEFETALRLDPANATARENLAQARAQRGAPRP